MNKESNEHLFNLLKQAMKQKKITYKELAAELGCSESSLKRSFGEKRVSTVRLFEILSSLGMDLADLLEHWHSGFKNEVFEISKELDQFFANNFKIFCLFRDIQKSVVDESGLSDSTYTPDELELLYKKLWSFKALKGKKIQDLKFICLRFPKNSLTVKKMTPLWGRAFFNEATSDGSSLNSKLWSQHLSENDAKQFKEELHELLEKYVTRSSIYKMSLRDMEPEFSFVAAYGFKTFETKFE